MRDVMVLMEEKQAFRTQLEIYLREGWEIAPNSLHIGTTEYVPMSYQENIPKTAYGSAFAVLGIVVLVRPVPDSPAQNPELPSLRRTDGRVV